MKQRPENIPPDKWAYRENLESRISKAVDPKPTYPSKAAPAASQPRKELRPVAVEPPAPAPASASRQRPQCDMPRDTPERLAIQARVKSGDVHAVDDLWNYDNRQTIKDEYAQRVITASAGTQDGEVAARTAADKRLEGYLNLWGKEVGAGLQYALRKALEAIVPTKDQRDAGLEPLKKENAANTLTAAGVNRQQVSVRCLTDLQKAALAKNYGEWLGTVEGSLEQVVVDTFGAVTQRAAIPVQQSIWGLSVPEDLLISDSAADINAELAAKTEQIRSGPLTSEERTDLVKRVASHQKYWSEKVAELQDLVDTDNFVDRAAKEQTVIALANAKFQAGIEPLVGELPANLKGGIINSGRGFFWTDQNLRAAFEYDIRNEGVAKLNEQAALQLKKLQKIDRKNLKDFDILDNVFHIGLHAGQGLTGKRNYLKYETARGWRDASGQGGYNELTLKGFSPENIVPDVEAFLNPGKLSAAEREISRRRILSFLQTNVPAPTPAKIEGLIGNKQFLKALTNPAILQGAVEKGTTGLEALSGTEARALAQGAVKDIRKNTLEGLVRQIDDAVCNGKTLEEALQEQESRAVRIAKDAANRLQSQAVQNIADNPYFSNKQKVWISELSVNTRIWHETAHGQRRDLNKPFRVGGANMQHPLDPSGGARNVANCRCRSIVTAQDPDGNKKILSLVDTVVPKEVA